MRLLQISDIHLLSNKDECLLSVPVYTKFSNTMNFILENKKRLSIDFIIVTGDISHDGSLSSYDLFFDWMERLKLPFSFIPGNHDNKKVLLNLNDRVSCFSDLGSLGGDDWCFLSIDSVVDGEDFGVINHDALSKFEVLLKKDPFRKKALFLHHHLLHVGTPLVDVCNLKNANELLSLCNKYGVKFIGSGHAHTPFQAKINDVIISVSPAICFQWENGTEDVSIFNASGFNIISFDEYVHIETYFI